MSLAVLISGSIWDFINGRKVAACAAGDVCETKPKPAVDMGKRAVTGAALSAGAAVAFYGMYKSVDVFIETADAGEIACWGINKCKGATACTIHVGRPKAVSVITPPSIGTKSPR